MGLALWIVMLPYCGSDVPSGTCCKISETAIMQRTEDICGKWLMPTSCPAGIRFRAVDRLGACFATTPIS